MKEYLGLCHPERGLVFANSEDQPQSKDLYPHNSLGRNSPISHER
jgi:hypothetical protein